MAKRHVEALRNVVEVKEVDELEFREQLISGKFGVHECVALHPFFLQLKLNWALLFELRRRCEKLIAFEVADSDAISTYAAGMVNNADLVIVPSTFAKYAYIRSGVRTPVEVLPHGVGEEFMREPREPKHEKLRQLLQLKREKGFKYVLFFLWHSGHRKGADLVYQVMKLVQSRRKDIILVVKRADIIDEHLQWLRKLRMIEVAGWLRTDDLVDLYDICDMLICPSRGGGFEMNAIEALARGLPTIVPKWGCFLDYIEYAIPVPVSGFVRVFTDNPVHTGYGAEIDVSAAADIILQVAEDLEEHKARARENAEAIRRRYSWRAVGDRLIQILRMRKVI